MTGRRTATIAALLAAGTLLVGCTEEENPDRTEIVTWTDEHGRACTGVVVVEGDDDDREVTSIDCAYPPQGQRPGRATTQPLPADQPQD